MDNSPFGLMDDITSVNKFSYYCGVSYDTINLIICTIRYLKFKSFLCVKFGNNT